MFEPDTGAPVLDQNDCFMFEAVSEIYLNEDPRWKNALTIETVGLGMNHN